MGLLSLLGMGASAIGRVYGRRPPGPLGFLNALRKTEKADGQSVGDFIAGVSRGHYGAQKTKALGESAAILGSRFEGAKTPGDFLERLLFRRSVGASDLMAGKMAQDAGGSVMGGKARNVAEYVDDTNTWPSDGVTGYLDDLISASRKAHEGAGATLEANAGRTFKLRPNDPDAPTGTVTWAGNLTDAQDATLRKALDAGGNKLDSKEVLGAIAGINAKAKKAGEQLAAHNKLDPSNYGPFGAARASAERGVFEAGKRARHAQGIGKAPFMGIPLWLINHPKTVLSTAAIGLSVGSIDSAAGYMHGGPGYGGYIGFNETSNLGGRNTVFQGANVNMNFEAQTMGFKELASNQILPQGSMGTAPMMSRRMGKQFQSSAQGLTLGLHKARRGGY